jgi:hypothetical protein
MTKRSYRRRSEDELIADYEAKIRQLEQKVEAKVRPDAVVLKDMPKMKRHLGKFSQLCMDNGRADLSNSILAFLATFEMQANQVPAGRSMLGRSPAGQH